MPRALRKKAGKAGIRKMKEDSNAQQIGEPVLLVAGLVATEWAVEFAIGWHNGFMKKYRQAQKEGRL